MPARSTHKSLCTTKVCVAPPPVTTGDSKSVTGVLEMLGQFMSMERPVASPQLRVTPVQSARARSLSNAAASSVGSDVDVLGSPPVPGGRMLALLPPAPCEQPPAATAPAPFRADVLAAVSPAFVARPAAAVPPTMAADVPEAARAAAPASEVKPKSVDDMAASILARLGGGNPPGKQTGPSEATPAGKRPGPSDGNPAKKRVAAPAFPGTDKHPPINYLGCTIYCNVPGRGWRVKRHPGARLDTKFGWGDNPKAKWQEVLAFCRCG